MELNIHENTGIVEVWLSNNEKNDPSIRAELKTLYARCKKNRYTVAVFESGGGDFYQKTRDLLAYNRKRSAEPSAKHTRPPHNP